jgi:hypothetical protein
MLTTVVLKPSRQYRPTLSMQLTCLGRCDWGAPTLTPHPVAPQVSWWGKRQQQYRREGALDRSGLPKDGSTAGYWCVGFGALTPSRPVRLMQNGCWLAPGL